MKSIVDKLCICTYNLLFRNAKKISLKNYTKFSSEFVRDINNTIYFMEAAVNECDDKECYRKLIKGIDDSINESEEKFGIRSVCKKGCYYCCKEKISITDSEWVFIKKAIQKLSNSVKIGIKSKAANIVDALNKVNMQFDFNLVNDYDKFKEFDEKEYNKKYLELNLRCPLLNDVNTCLIYDSRPLTCVMYRNYGLRIDCKYHKGINTYNFQEYSIWGECFLQVKSKPTERIRLLVNWICDEL